MRKFLLTCVITSLIIGLSGCGKSVSDTQQVRDLCSQARDLFNQATAILGRSDMGGDDAANSDKVISLLDKAASSAQQAANVDGASDAAKAPAYKLLAQIHKAKASTVAYSARRMNMAVSQLLPKAIALKSMVAEAEAQKTFLAELGVAVDSNTDAKLNDLAKEVLNQYRGQLESVSNRIENIQEHLEITQNHINELAAKAEPVRRKGVDYRRRMVRTEGKKVLELDSLAGQAEKQYAEMQDEIGELLLEAENTQKTLDIAMSRQESIRQTIVAAEDTITLLDGRADLIDSSYDDAKKQFNNISEQYKAASAEISKSFTEMSAVYESAISAYSKADNFAKSALRAAKDISNQARKLKSDTPKSPVKDALADMSSRSATNDEIIAEADILAAAANLRRELLEKAMSVAQLAENPDKLLGDIKQLVADADQDYATAIEKYQQIAESMDKSVAWMVQSSQAHALWARYKLTALTGTANVQYLHQAAEIISGILSENRGKSQYSSVENIEKLIAAAMK